MSDWMMTRSGRRVWPFHMVLSDVNIEDIAHSLSLQCRFNGHCNRFYSVAEHCVHVSAALWSAWDNTLWAKQGLIHDAHEAYTGDLIRPIKERMGTETALWYKLEEDAEATVAESLQVQWPFDAIVKVYDQRIIMNEKEALFDGDGPWDDELPPLDVVIRCWSPERAKEMYLEQWRRLHA